MMISMLTDRRVYPFYTQQNYQANYKQLGRVEATPHNRDMLKYLCVEFPFPIYIYIDDVV